MEKKTNLYRPILRLLKGPADCVPLASNNNTFSLHQREARCDSPQPLSSAYDPILSSRKARSALSALSSTVSILLTSGNGDGGKERSEGTPDTIMKGYI